MESRMKGLYFTGEFNPPTVAHIELANYVRKYLDYDKVVFVPSKSKYIQGLENNAITFPAEERYMMLRRISISRPWMDISDVEIHSEDQPQAYHFLRQMKERGYDLKLLIGSDCLKDLEHDFSFINEIFEEFGIVVMTRNHQDVKALIDKNEFLKRNEKAITIVQTPDRYQDISSSKVRELAHRMREEVRELRSILPDELEALEEFIYQK